MRFPVAGRARLAGQTPTTSPTLLRDLSSGSVALARPLSLGRSLLIWLNKIVRQEF